MEYNMTILFSMIETTQYTHLWNVIEIYLGILLVKV